MSRVINLYLDHPNLLTALAVWLAIALALAGGLLYFGLKEVTKRWSF